MVFDAGFQYRTCLANIIPDAGKGVTLSGRSKPTLIISPVTHDAACVPC
jgi:hypothetical protein